MDSDSLYTGSGESSSSRKQMSCKHCGHRCCRRRFEYEKQKLKDKSEKQRSPKNCEKQKLSKVEKRRVQRNKRRDSKKKPKNRQLRISKSCLLKGVSVAQQFGSPCATLSTLFVAAGPAPAPPEEGQTYSEVTPEMIHQSLRVLTMWREGVSTEAIYNYIMSNYPVNPNPEEVMLDLLEKLRVAIIAGIVFALPNDHWRLTGDLEHMNKLDQSHVTLFWKAYGNTLKPLDKNLQRSSKLEQDEKRVGSEASLRIVDGDNTNTVV